MPRGTITERLKITLKNILFHRFLAGGMIFPPPSGMLDPCQIFKQQLKNHLFQLYLTILKKKKKKKKNFFSKSSSFYLSFSPSLASLYLFEQCLRLGVIATSSVCLPLQD